MVYRTVISDPVLLRRKICLASIAALAYFIEAGAFWPILGLSAKD